MVDHQELCITTLVRPPGCRAQVVDERLAGSSVEYLQLNELSEALQRNLQSMHHAKCLFMMRAWHQARF